MMKTSGVFSLCIGLTLLTMGLSCKSHKPIPMPVTASTPSRFVPIAQPGPRLIIYQTEVDCADLVPIVLSADGKEIVSYPAPQDIAKKDLLGAPKRLSGGWLLDQQGISPHTAYLGMSLADYAQLKQPLSLAAMMARISIKAPFTAMYDAGLKTDLQTKAIEEALANRTLDFTQLKKLK